MTEEEKAVQRSEVVSDYVPPGVTSFADLDAAKESEAVAQMTMTTAEQFMSIARNILYSDEVADKASAISALSNEFAGRLDDAMEVKAVWSTKFVNDLPDGSFLHILPGGEKDGEGKTKPRTLRMFPYKDKSGKVDLPHLRNAIARIPQSNRIDTATKEKLQTKARNILKKQQKEKSSGVVKWVKGKLGMQPPKNPEPFTLWKEGDSMRWFAVYSNNYRDDDGTPEILSKESHLDFVRAVDAGEWPKPELWHWHVKGTRYGQADFVAYDADSGMAISAGTIDKGKEEIATTIFERGPLVSHGMPTPEIERDENDPTVITRYRTKEISTLPSEAAANKITFYDLKESENMNIPKHKLEELREAGFDVDALAAKLEEGKEQAESEERESKETKVEEKETIEETVETQPETEAAPEPEVEPLTAEGIAEAFNTAISPLVERLDAVEGQIKELTAEPETKEKELDLTPAASLTSMMKSAVIGQEAAQVDGRVSRHDAPAENVKEAPILNGNNMLSNAIVDAVVSGNWRKDLPGVQQ